MAFTVYDGILAYAKTANSGLYLSCRTSIFNNPADQIYTMKGKKTLVRQYEAGKAGNYDKTKGWLQSYGGGKGVEWIEYTAPFDRAKVLSTDAVDELQSYANGMTPSIELLNSDFFNNQLPGEIDAANIAQFYSRIPDANIKESNVYDVSEDGILDTLINLENDIFNSGYDGDSVLFIRADVYKNFQKALVKNYGLASGALISKTMTVNIDTGLSKVIAGGTEDIVSVNVEVLKFNKFYVIKMPDDRMYNMITMLDGTSTGQEAGGYIPDNKDPDFGLVDLLAIPTVAAFTNVRHLIDNFLVPASFPTSGFTSVDLEKLNQQMYGNIEIGFAGINQKANAFEYDARIIYGGDIFDNRRRNCFAVKHVATVDKEKVDSITFSPISLSNFDTETVTVTVNDGASVSDVELRVAGAHPEYLAVSNIVANEDYKNEGVFTVAVTEPEISPEITMNIVATAKDTAIVELLPVTIGTNA
jgi:hypothetical protein